MKGKRSLKITHNDVTYNLTFKITRLKRVELTTRWFDLQESGEVNDSVSCTVYKQGLKLRLSFGRTLEMGTTFCK